MAHYTALPLRHALPAVALPRSAAFAGASVTLEDRALPLMTDLRDQARVTVRPDDQIDRALEEMAHAGVKSAFVLDDTQDHRLIGHITAYDIQGEKPMRYLQSIDCNIGICSRDDVRVRHVMEPVDVWQVVELDSLKTARVGNVVETLKAIARKHLIVVESHRDRSTTIVCGLISASAIERKLGAAIDTEGSGTRFVDIERALA